MALMDKVKQHLTVDNNWTDAQIRALYAIFEDLSALEAEFADLTLGDLADVDTAGATDGQQLTFDDGTDTWGPGDANPA